MRIVGIVVCATLGVAAANLAACDLTSGNTFTAPSGATVYTAKCHPSSDACFQKASATCAGPYLVVNSERYWGGILTESGAGTMWYAMTYQCGPSDGKMPTFAFRDGPTVNANINIEQR
jgi:hypothetical protein